MRIDDSASNCTHWTLQHNLGRTPTPDTPFQCTAHIELEGPDSHMAAQALMIDHVTDLMGRPAILADDGEFYVNWHLEPATPQDFQASLDQGATDNEQIVRLTVTGRDRSQSFRRRMPLQLAHMAR